MHKESRILDQEKSVTRKRQHAPDFLFSKCLTFLSTDQLGLHSKPYLLASKCSHGSIMTTILLQQPAVLISTFEAIYCIFILLFLQTVQMSLIFRSCFSVASCFLFKIVVFCFISDIKTSREVRDPPTAQVSKRLSQPFAKLCPCSQFFVSSSIFEI